MILAARTTAVAARAPLHLPEVVRTWLADDPATRHRTLDGTLLFADVSGFTALTERLAARGKEGAEDLTDVLDGIMSELLGLAQDRGGDLLKYGGDALLLLFTGDEHAARAVDAGWSMQQAIRVPRSSRAGQVRLGMSVGVATGSVDLLLLGDTHRELLIAGPVAETVVALESGAGRGNIDVSPTTRDQAPRAETEAVADDRLRVVGVRDLRPPKVEPAVAPTIDDVVARTGIASGLRAVVDAGTAGEHRQVCVGFVQVRDLPDLAGPDAVDTLDDLVRTVQRAADDAGVTFLSSDIDGGAAKFILTAGAPAASDVDVDRMLAATRRIVSAELPFRLRAGVNSGRVFAVELGTTSRRFYTVLGDDVNLAARVMGKADDRSVLATTAALAEARDRYLLTPVEPFLVKGKTHPVSAAVVGDVTDEDGAPEASAAVTLHGRGVERGRLLDALGAARAGGRAETLTLLGGAGTGKSALVEDALADARPDLVIRVEPGLFSVGTPYFAMRGVLRTALGLDRDASRDDVVAAITAVGGEAFAPWLPLALPAFGYTMADTPETAAVHPRFRRARAHSLVADLIEPRLPDVAVMVIEDAQWLDDASRELLEHLLGALGARPWTVVVCSRSADHLPRIDRPGRTAVLELEPLDDEDAVRFVTGTGDDRLPAEVVAAIVARGGGNPLFLRELRDAVRAGTDVDALPDRIERLLAERVDHLAHADRDLLRAASVLGDRFRLRTLAALVEEPWLTRDAVRTRLGDLLVPDGPGRLRFAQELVRSSAYESLAFRTRRALHGAAADHYLRTARDHDAIVELVALHTHRAERWGEAWRWCVAAGERAAASDAPVEALRFFTWAVDAAVEAEPPAAELLHVLRRLALSAELASRLDVADRALRRAATLTDDPVTLAALCEHRGRIRDRQGRFEVALRWYRRGRRHLGDGSVGGDDARAAWLELELGRAQALGRLRRLRPSERVLRAVLDDPRTDDHRALLARACTLLAGVLGDLGDAEATAWRDRSFPIYEELGDLVGQARALGNRGVDAYYDGDWDLAVELYERAGELAERAGDSLNQILLRSNLAEVLSDRGDLARASELLLDVLATARAAGYDAGTALAHGNLGRAATRAGDVEGAREHLAEARRRWEAMGDDAMVVEIDIREAERLLADGEPQAALERVEQARVAGFRVDALAWHGPPLDRVAALAEARLGAAATALVRLTAARDAAAGVSRIDELWILEATVEVLRQLDRRDEADRVDTERRALARELGID